MTHRTPAYIFAKDGRIVTVVDAWSPWSTIDLDRDLLPPAVVEAVEAGCRVVAEVIVNLSAVSPEDVVIEVVRAVSVPSDESLGWCARRQG